MHREKRPFFSVVVNRLQTLPSPGDYTHQPPSSQTRCRLLAKHHPAGPPPPQPQSCHPQLHAAEPGSDLRLRPRKRLRCPPDSRVCQHPGQPAARPTRCAAEGHGFHQARVPFAHPAVCIRATSGPDQCATGKENREYYSNCESSCIMSAVIVLNSKLYGCAALNRHIC